MKYRVDGGVDVVSVGVPAIEKKPATSGGDIDMKDTSGKDEKKEYVDVALSQCINDAFLGMEVIDGWVCSQCQGKGAIK